MSKYFFILISAVFRTYLRLKLLNFFLVKILKYIDTNSKSTNKSKRTEIERVLPKSKPSNIIIRQMEIKILYVRCTNNCIKKYINCIQNADNMLIIKIRSLYSILY